MEARTTGKAALMGKTSQVRAQNPAQLLSKDAIARERIEILLSLSQQHAKTNPKFAARSINLARKIAKRHRVRFTTRQKMLFCKKCESPFAPGFNVSIHLDSRRHLLVHTCKTCGFSHNYSYRRSNKSQ